MSTLHRRKEKNEMSRRLSLCNDGEGSAARTRPFSFEEIMLRRKRKGLSDDVKEGVVEAQVTSNEGVVKNVSHSFEPEKGYSNKNVSHSSESERGYGKRLTVAERHLPEEESKEGSIKNERKTSESNRHEESRLKGEDRGTRPLKRKLGSIVCRPNDDTGNESKGGRNDKQIHDRRENEKRSTDNTQKEAGKRNPRDSRGKERHAELSRGKSEREIKGKFEYGDDEKIKNRNAAKKLDTGRHYEADNSARNKRKESSQSRFVEPKQRRERSRNRNHDDRNRRSRSPSPKDHKRASYNRVTYMEDASHTLKDRSRKQHHVDRNKLSSNGSSSHHARRGETTSGLGGYSPRKRLTEAAAKTPPPPDHLSEKKSAKWDILPAGTGNILSGSFPSNFQSLSNIVSTGVQELASTAPVASTFPQLPSKAPPASLSAKSLASIDSVQLTQATRPMRRLYVENIPSSTFEKALVEWFNDLLLSSGVNHIQGTQPCISCIINKEKGQALVEFLTAEDASAALSFDGSSISGSVLKIRRPKDFVEVATGDLEKSMDAVDMVSDVVKDSPNKIFIGGISQVLSSKMLMEIVSAFGPLKAYHFAVNDELNEPCAFLEYVDQSIAPKACAGLNGIKFGGKVLTAVQAIRSAESLGNSENSSLYKIPEHAKPLLKQPMQVIKLKNVFNLEEFSSLSESDVEEVVEDIRLECARFGNVRSVNVVKLGNSNATSTRIELDNSAETAELGPNLGCDDTNAKTDNLGGHTNGELSGTDAEMFTSNDQDPQEDEVPKDCTDNKQPDIISEDESCQTGQLKGDENVPTVIPKELPSQLNSPKDPKELSEHLDDKVAITTLTDADGAENKLKTEDYSTLGSADSEEQETFEEIDSSKTESNAIEDDVSKEESVDLGSIFEVGCVFVEFGRTEAACTAAHCLHGRVFDDRIVSVEYVAFDHYKTRFLK